MYLDTKKILATIYFKIYHDLDIEFGYSLLLWNGRIGLNGVDDVVLMMWRVWWYDEGV